MHELTGCFGIVFKIGVSLCLESRRPNTISIPLLSLWNIVYLLRLGKIELDNSALLPVTLSYLVIIGPSFTLIILAYFYFSKKYY